MNNSIFYKIGAVISILLIGIIIAFIMLAKGKKDDVAKTEEQEFVVSSTNATEENNEVNEFKEIENTANEPEPKSENFTEENTSKQTSTNSVTDKKSANVKNENKGNLATQKSLEENEKPVEENKKEEELVFKYPVDGEISMEYAKDKLVYSNTLGEWITHLGVDIKANKATVVKACADGTVKSISTDPRYGLTVVVEHKDGFATIYSNLLTAEFVKSGEKVTSGQTIGTVGNTASFEILEESHLHFEITKDGEQVDPTIYLKK